MTGYCLGLFILASLTLAQDFPTFESLWIGTSIASELLLCAYCAKEIQGFIVLLEQEIKQEGKAKRRRALFVHHFIVLFVFISALSLEQLHGWIAITCLCELSSFVLDLVFIAQYFELKGTPMLILGVCLLVSYFLTRILLFTCVSIVSIYQLANPK